MDLTKAGIQIGNNVIKWRSVFYNSHRVQIEINLIILNVNKESYYSTLRKFVLILTIYLQVNYRLFSIFYTYINSILLSTVYTMYSIHGSETMSAAGVSSCFELTISRFDKWLLKQHESGEPQNICNIPAWDNT